MIKYLLSWGFAISCAFANITVNVEPKKVMQGEPIQLTISSDSANNAQPDFSPLVDKFNIIGTEKSMNYVVVNQRAQSLTAWTLYLMPKVVGNIQIPALHVGNESTKPIEISVNTQQIQKSTHQASSNNTKNSVGKLMNLETTTDTKTPYVHQQVIYTVKIYNRSAIIDAEYMPPSTKQALVFPIGNGERTETMLNGQVYALETLKYAIFPQKSGEISINSPKFSAIVENYPPQKISLTHKATPLSVKTIPKHIGDWLPAKQVSLSLSPLDKNRVETGEALSQILTIQATGMPAQLLPTPKLPKTEGVSIYSEKLRDKNRFQGDTIVGTKRYKLTYVFDKSGSTKLEPIKLHWFNTDSEKNEVATSDVQTIDVIAKEKITPSPSTHAQNNAPTTSVFHTERFLHPAIRMHPIAVLLLLLLSYTAIHQWKRKKKNLVLKMPTKVAAVKWLKSACASNDKLMAKKALFSIFSTESKPIINLKQITEIVSDVKFIEEILILNQALYQNKNQAWLGENLWSAYQALNKKKQLKSSSPLPPLNPGGE